MVMTDTIATFLVCAFSLWAVKKIAGGGLTASFSAIFAASAFYALFGLLFLGFPWGFIFHKYTIYWLFFLDGVFLPFFIFWFAGKALDGFELKARKYYPRAVGLFMIFSFIGLCLAQLIPLVGLGLFCGGGYSVGRYSRPGWLYAPGDYYWYYYHA